MSPIFQLLKISSGGKSHISWVEQVAEVLEHVGAVAQAAAQEQVAALTQELTAAQALATQAQENMSAAEAAHKAERDEDGRQLSEMRTALECAEAASARLLTQRADLEASLSAAQQENDAAIAQASEHAAQTASQISNLEGRVADLQVRLASAEASLRASAEAQGQLQTDRGELAAALAQTADALQKSDSTVRELQDRHTTLVTAHERCGELEAALQASADTQAQLQADRDELAASLTETADALQNSEKASSELQGRHSALLAVHECCTASEASLGASAEVHAQLVTDRDELAASLEETAAALQRSEAARDDIQTRHDAFMATAHGYEQHITHLRAQVDDAQQQISDGLISQMGASEHLAAQGASDLQQSQDQVAVLREQLLSLEQALAEKGAQLTSAAELHASDTLKLTEQVKELQQNHERTEGAYQAVREQITSLEAQVQASTEQLSRSGEALSGTNEELSAKLAVLQVSCHSSRACPAHHRHFACGAVCMTGRRCTALHTCSPGKDRCTHYLLSVWPDAWAWRSWLTLANYKGANVGMKHPVTFTGEECKGARVGGEPGRPGGPAGQYG